jgi:hypothetical protein
MTALTVPSRRSEDASLRPVPWRRMAWVTWRQHRLALIGVAALLGGLSAYLWIAGRYLRDAYASASACHPASSIVCGSLAYAFNNTNGLLWRGYVLQALPALIGAFVGAPLLARELETGTFRYAWTQGFGPWRWTLAKLVLLAAVLAAAAGAFSLLVSWYYHPYLSTANPARFLDEWSPLSTGLFSLRGTAFVAWTLAAFAIGGLAGMLIRRVVPAIVATLAVYAGLALATGLYLREHYLSPLVTSSLHVPGSAWIISVRWLNGSGIPVSDSDLGQVLSTAPPALTGKGGVPNSVATWQFLNRHGFTRWTTYQPAHRFWMFQLIETGWLLALSAVLIGATVWLVRRRAT